MTSRLALRCVALVCIAGYALLRFGDPSYRDILDDVDLAVHEAGHVLFQGLGEPAYRWVR